MPKVQVVFYQEAEGSVPVLDWLDTLQPKAQDKCLVKIERLQELGMNCGDRKRISSETASMNSVWDYRGSIIESSISFTARLRPC